MLRLLFGLLLLVAGFFAGSAWTNKVTPPAETPPEKVADDTAMIDVRTTQDRAIEAENKPGGRAVSEASELTAEERATIRLFEDAAPSVCFITTSNLRQDFFDRNITEIPRGTGSGFVWDQEGHIVTNFHVLRGADKARVTLSDQSTWEATLVGFAPEKDLAVLRIDAPARKLRPIPVGASDRLRVGQSVFAIGNPFGLDQTLTTGIVSALDREIKSVAGIPIRGAIQTDAAINPGNSGGPLLDSSGRLIGVNTAIYSPSGASAGIGFSIPVDVVRWVIPELIQYGEVRRAGLGVELAQQRTIDRFGLDGPLIINVIPDGPADKAGLRPTRRSQQGEILLGDIIVGINGKEVTSYSDLFLALEPFKPGETVTVRVLRDNETLDVPITLERIN